MTTQHTPGPWAIRAHDLMQRIQTHDGHTVAIPAMNDGVSALASSANARLIAAAPALLEALLDALPYVEDVLSDPDALACFKPGTVERHAKAIRAAIARATATGEGQA